MHSGRSIARRLRRHWALLAVCAVFPLAGAFALDDYGIRWEEAAQRAIGNAAIDYVLGDGERAFDQVLFAGDQYYGAAFEGPFFLAVRILGLAEDGPRVLAAKDFLTHLFFLAGGVCCYLLALRLFGNRLLALVAMALFLLHPRIYAHSFFNSKDIPFLAMFMVSLFFAHRAFRREALGAFLLCGVAVGLLVNLRIMGLLLFAGVLAPLALDVAFARNRGERGRALLTGAAFALAAMLTYHASLPALWTDPVGRFAELVRALDAHRHVGFELFRGEWWYTPDGLPFDYVPVWVGITTPSATLLLALAGTVTLAWRGARRPRDLLRNTPLRFGLLLIALPVATVVAFFALESNLTGDWRQLYFLHAPVLLLAAFGLQWLVAAARGRWMRAGAYALAGAAIAVTVVSLIRIHPHGINHFTVLTARAAPGALPSSYAMHLPVLQSTRDLYAAIAREHPSGVIPFSGRADAPGLFPPDDRRRVVPTRDFRSGERGFHEIRAPDINGGETLDGRLPCPDPLPAGSHAVRLYGATLLCVVDPLAYFGGLRREALATAPLDRSRFAAHRVGNLMVYLRDGCSPDDLDARAFIRVRPVDEGDVPPWRAEYGFERLTFALERHGVRIDGNCVAVMPLPEYPIAGIRTGQYTPAYAGAVRRAAAGAEPVARSRFTVWLDGRTLTYARDACSEDDAAARFFLHAYPVDAGDIPAGRAEHGFANLDFEFRTYGAFTDDGGCALAVPLPAYPIASIRTGQHDADGERWAVEFAFPE